MIDDGHSGNSWYVTKHILMALMSGRPLTPITEKDFDGVDGYESDKKGRLVIHKQCPRMHSLFRTEYEDGSIEYNDNDRVSVYDMNENYNHNICCHIGFVDNIVNEMYPIAFQYTGRDKYKVYGETFAMRDYSELGCFDTAGYYEIVLPDGTKKPFNKFYKECEHRELVEITKEEFDERMRIAKENADNKNNNK